MVMVLLLALSGSWDARYASRLVAPAAIASTKAFCFGVKGICGVSTLCAGTPLLMRSTAAGGIACPSNPTPDHVNEIRTHYDRLSAVVNRPSERPIVADEWSVTADNWLLTADMLSPILCFAVQPPYTTWSKRHEPDTYPQRQILGRIIRPKPR